MRLAHTGTHAHGGVHWGVTGGQNAGVGIVWLFVLGFLAAMALMLGIAAAVLGSP